MTVSNKAVYGLKGPEVLLISVNIAICHSLLLAD